MASLEGCIVTLVAFVWLFSIVSLHMWPQSTWIRACIVTLVAFIWLFSTMYFQMSPQITCPREFISTLNVFVWIFFIVCPSHWNCYIIIACVQMNFHKVLIHYRTCFSSPDGCFLLCRNYDWQQIIVRAKIESEFHCLEFTGSTGPGMVYLHFTLRNVPLSCSAKRIQSHIVLDISFYSIFLSKRNFDLAFTWIMWSNIFNFQNWKKKSYFESSISFE